MLCMLTCQPKRVVCVFVSQLSTSLQEELEQLQHNAEVGTRVAMSTLTFTALQAVHDWLGIWTEE